MIAKIFPYITLKRMDRRIVPPNIPSKADRQNLSTYYPKICMDRGIFLHNTLFGVDRQNSSVYF